MSDTEDCGMIAWGLVDMFLGPDLCGRVFVIMFMLNATGIYHHRRLFRVLPF